MLDTEHQLIGVFCDDRYRIGDYEILVSQITDGYTLTITKGDEVQVMTIHDGESPDLTEMNELLTTMRDAASGYAAAEEARAAAEALRELAENGPANKNDPETNAEKAQYRSGLYGLMLDLYNQYYPTLSNNLQAIQTAKDAALAAQAAAELAQQRAQAMALDRFAGNLFYFNEDVLSWTNPVGDDYVHDSSAYTGATNVTASTTSLAYEGAFFGYCSSARRGIRLIIPVAKSLYFIDDVRCDNLMLNISNSGGYAVSSSYSVNGTQYKNWVNHIQIDKVQNCLHVLIDRGSAFTLTNNEPVRASAGEAVSGSAYPPVHFTLFGSALSDSILSSSESISTQSEEGDDIIVD